MDFKKVDSALSRWKYLFYSTLVVYVSICFFYVLYSISYTPKEQTILLNQMGGVYVSEDLGRTNVSEGEVKQFAFEVISKTFSYNFVSYAEKEDYEKIISGEKESDLPDHRDTFSSYYSPDAYEKVKEELVAQDWMRNFHYERRQLLVSFTEPPSKVSSQDFYKNESGRLSVDYKGYFFLISNSKKHKQKTYKIGFTVTLERKPLIIQDGDYESKYYFPPMVPNNTMEWRIVKFDFESERRT